LAVKEDRTKSAMELLRWQVSNEVSSERQKVISEFLTKAAYYSNYYLVERMMCESMDPNYEDEFGYPM
jgi:hypothetical protein